MGIGEFLSQKIDPVTLFKAIMLGVLGFILFYLMMKLMILDEAINLPVDEILRLRLK